MSPPTLLQRYRAWLGASLRRRTTVHVAAGLLALIAITATISLASTWLFIQEQQLRDLERRADTVSEAFAATLNGWQESIASLARNSVLGNALLDSAGREQYLVPFLREFDLRIEEQLGLTLCDLLARPLASTGLADPDCYEQHPAFRAAIEEGRSSGFLVREGGKLQLVLITPVVYPATGTPEGALVGRLALSAWFDNPRHIAAGFAVRLQDAGETGLLLHGGPPIGPLAWREPPVHAPLSRLGLRLLVGSDATASAERPLGHFLFAHASAALLLLALGIAYARLTADRLTRPLSELAHTARQIAEGDLARRADEGGGDEVGRLAAAFNRMVTTLEGAKQRLEAEVEARTAELSESERRLRRRAAEVSALLDAVPALLMHTATPDSRELRVNQALRTLLAEHGEQAGPTLTPQQLMVIGLRHFGAPVAFQDWPLAKAAAEGVAVSDFPCEITLPDGSLRHLLGNAVPLGPGGGAVAAFLDVTSLRRAEQRIYEEEQRYHRLFELMPEPLWVHDGNLIQMTNTAMARLTGYDSPEELVGQHVLSFVHPDDRLAIATHERRLAAGEGQLERIPFRLIRRDGSHRYVELSAGLLRLKGSSVTQAVVRDVTARRHAEEQTRLAAQVFESSQDGIFICDADNRILSVNRAFSERTGYPPEEAVGRDPGFLSSGRHDSDYYRDMWQALAGRGHWENEILNRHRNGELLAQWISVSVVRDSDGRLTHYITVLSEITERRASSARMAWLAHHDPLTALPNRTLLDDRIEQALAVAAREQQGVALLFIDLDGFKAVNDSFGHAVGDELLRQVAERMRTLLRRRDTVSRLGGDEFVVLLAPVADAAQALQVAEKICRTLAAPYTLGAVRITTLSASIGVALYPEDGNAPAALLARADAAMYRAKRAGRNRALLAGEPEPASLTADPVI